MSLIYLWFENWDDFKMWVELCPDIALKNVEFQALLALVDSTEAPRDTRYPPSGWNLAPN